LRVKWDGDEPPKSFALPNLAWLGLVSQHSRIQELDRRGPSLRSVIELNPEAVAVPTGYVPLPVAIALVPLGLTKT